MTDPMTSSIAGFGYLAENDSAATEELLHRLGWLAPDETVQRLERAGEGNMNLTLRMNTPRRSFILKQSRPWVEKYPQISAPEDRALRERDFYERVASLPEVTQRLPRLLAWDEAARLLMLEDLGLAADCTGVYHGQSFETPHLEALARFSAALHRGTATAGKSPLSNREMRRLNHEHIFDIPWRPGAVAGMGLDLDALEPGLCDAANRLRQRAALRERAAEVGRRYLADGPCLLHGDFFPGSFLAAERGLFVIDAEFCYFGEQEFDLGVFIAHLALANEPLNQAGLFLDVYRRHRPGAPLNERRLTEYAACEVIRRLIGVAQLPIPPSTGKRAALLNRAAAALDHSQWKELFA